MTGNDLFHMVARTPCVCPVKTSVNATNRVPTSKTTTSRVGGANCGSSSLLFALSIAELI